MHTLTFDRRRTSLIAPKQWPRPSSAAPGKSSSCSCYVCMPPWSSSLYSRFFLAPCTLLPHSSLILNSSHLPQFSLSSHPCISLAFIRMRTVCKTPAPLAHPFTTFQLRHHGPYIWQTCCSKQSVHALRYLPAAWCSYSGI